MEPSELQYWGCVWSAHGIGMALDDPAGSVLCLAVAAEMMAGRMPPYELLAAAVAALDGRERVVKEG